MLTHTLTFNQAKFELAKDCDVAALKQKCAMALATEASYVDFESAWGEQVSLLIGRGAHVHFSAIEPEVHDAIGSGEVGHPSNWQSFSYLDLDLDVIEAAA